MDVTDCLSNRMAIRDRQVSPFVSPPVRTTSLGKCVMGDGLARRFRPGGPAFAIASPNAGRSKSSAASRDEPRSASSGPPRSRAVQRRSVARNANAGMVAAPSPFRPAATELTSSRGVAVVPAAIRFGPIGRRRCPRSGRRQAGLRNGHGSSIRIILAAVLARPAVARDALWPKSCRETREGANLGRVIGDRVPLQGPKSCRTRTGSSARR